MKRITFANHPRTNLDPVVVNNCEDYYFFPSQVDWARVDEISSFAAAFCVMGSNWTLEAAGKNYASFKDPNGAHFSAPLDNFDAFKGIAGKTLTCRRAFKMWREAVPGRKRSLGARASFFGDMMAYHAVGWAAVPKGLSHHLIATQEIDSKLTELIKQNQAPTQKFAEFCTCFRVALENHQAWLTGLTSPGIELTPENAPELFEVLARAEARLDGLYALAATEANRSSKSKLDELITEAKAHDSQESEFWSKAILPKAPS